MFTVRYLREALGFGWKHSRGEPKVSAQALVERWTSRGKSVKELEAKIQSLASYHKRQSVLLQKTAWQNIDVGRLFSHCVDRPDFVQFRFFYVVTELSTTGGCFSARRAG